MARSRILGVRITRAVVRQVGVCCARTATDSAASTGVGGGGGGGRGPLLLSKAAARPALPLPPSPLLLEAFKRALHPRVLHSGGRQRAARLAAAAVTAVVPPPPPDAAPPPPPPPLPPTLPSPQTLS